MHIKTIGGNGGDGCISFLSEWANEYAGPDGGDGGNGGHVILQACTSVKDLKNVDSVVKAEQGEKGSNRDCHGKNADHTLIKVPVGTVIKDANGCIVGDLKEEGSMFLAARGGAGGKGNKFFTSPTQQSPDICEYGAIGENINYHIEISSIAHIGLVGLPNAGKSTLLQAISRARPKIAPYPFTTLKPHIGMVLYNDYEQIAVADLPGLIEDSHKNKGLGIQFLRHIERCSVLLFILDMSLDQPWNSLDILKNELSHYSNNLLQRSQLVVANKIDLLDRNDKLKQLRDKTDLEVFPLSAKTGQNVGGLLQKIRILYDKNVNKT
ncbi:mitochondrial ribosome-associated GTPase 2 isoform X2 [Agrilus planipennis]|nr:mitochondrial ribosome-associated GTPase 2 isoform X2 [Agrilus planipennis]